MVQKSSSTRRLVWQQLKSVWIFGAELNLTIFLSFSLSFASLPVDGRNRRKFWRNGGRRQMGNFRRKLVKLNFLVSFQIVQFSSICATFPVHQSVLFNSREIYWNGKFFSSSNSPYRHSCLDRFDCFVNINESIVVKARPQLAGF